MGSSAPYPTLYDCPVLGEQCALLGCFYESLVRRMRKAKGELGAEGAEQLAEEIKKEAREIHCKKYSTEKMG